MPDIPEEAVQAAAEALSALSDHPPVYWQIEARAALEAAMPILEQRLRHEISAWLIRDGKRSLREHRKAPDTDNLGLGWAGAFIGAGLMVEAGYPMRRADLPEEATDDSQSPTLEQSALPKEENR